MYNPPTFTHEVHSQVIAWAKSGIRPRLIYDKLDGKYTLRQINTVVSRARKRGVKIPHFPSRAPKGLPRLTPPKAKKLNPQIELNIKRRDEVLKLGYTYRPRLIYEILGGEVGYGYITGVLSRARRKGKPIPKRAGGRLPGKGYHLPRVTKQREESLW